MVLPALWGLESRACLEEEAAEDTRGPCRPGADAQASWAWAAPVTFLPASASWLLLAEPLEWPRSLAAANALLLVGGRPVGRQGWFCFEDSSRGLLAASGSVAARLAAQHRRVFCRRLE